MSLYYVFEGAVDSKLSLSQLAWHQICEKLLLEPMVTQFNDTSIINRTQKFYSATSTVLCTVTQSSHHVSITQFIPPHQDQYVFSK